MASEIRKCPSCGKYTLLNQCKHCRLDTVCPIPPRYSPEDRMGEYRRKTILEVYGENGKLNKI